MLMELDTQATFQDVKPEASLDQLPKESKVGALVDKIVARQREIEAQQAALKSIYTDHSKSLKDQLDILSGIREFAEYNLEEFGKQ